METWAAWALTSALFAALTAIFAKIGLERDQLSLRDFYPHDHHRLLPSRVPTLR